MGDLNRRPYILTIRSIAMAEPPRYVAQIVRLCRSMRQTDLRYGIYYATSDNKWKIFDISRAKAELGYAPEDGSGSEFTRRPATNEGSVIRLT